MPRDCNPAGPDGNGFAFGERIGLGRSNDDAGVRPAQRDLGGPAVKRKDGTKREKREG
jgi:hypothetical protein